MKGRCQYCGCTESAACEGGCSWADASETLCSACEWGAEIASLFLTAHDAVRERAEGQRRPAIAWAARPPKVREAYVMTTRAVLDAIRESFLESIGLEAAGAAIDLARLAKYLETHHAEACDRAIAAKGTHVDVALELLGERRVVLAR